MAKKAIMKTMMRRRGMLRGSKYLFKKNQFLAIITEKQKTDINMSCLLFIGMFLVFDTETTGIPKRIKGKYPSPKLFEHYDGARVIELSWCVYENSGKCVAKRSRLIKFLGEIPNSHIHNITNEMTLDGIEFLEVARALMYDLKRVDTIVAHNINFDLFVLTSELYRHGLYDIAKIMWSKNRKDTMQMSGARFVKLQTLYAQLYPENSKRLFTDENPGHRALVDVKACALCYFKLL